MYPLTGYTSGEFSPLETSLLVGERMAFKMHREGLVWNSVGRITPSVTSIRHPSSPKTDGDIRW
jgi:conjugal transfer pilus assembly protein TraU